MNNLNVIKSLMSEGYPYEIYGNDGYKATLYGKQLLNDGNYVGIYKYPRGECCHSLKEAQRFHNIHNEICIELFNPYELDNSSKASFVSMYFTSNSCDKNHDYNDSLVGYTIYDEHKNEIDGGEFEVHSSKEIWTIEDTVDSVLYFALGRNGFAYKTVSYDISDFENDIEEER